MIAVISAVHPAKGQTYTNLAKVAGKRLLKSDLQCDPEGTGCVEPPADSTELHG